jgi:anti-anti-sigma factor
MQISVKTTNEVKVLAFEGKLDTQTSPDAQQQLTRLIEEGETKILVNLEKVDYISSAGLLVLLMVAKKLKLLNGEVVLASLKDDIKEIFEIAGFLSIFQTFGTREEAEKSFSST